MQFCLRHWEMMRAAVEARGMTPLVAENGKSAVNNVVDELQSGMSLDNFDPLMAMHWNISGNLMDKLGPSALYLLGSGEEDVIDVDQIADAELKTKYAGKTWPRCPICYINIAHEFSCGDSRCTLTKADGYDICIEWSADSVKESFDALMAGKQPGA